MVFIIELRSQKRYFTSIKVDSMSKYVLPVKYFKEGSKFVLVNRPKSTNNGLLAAINDTDTNAFQLFKRKVKSEDFKDFQSNLEAI